VNSFTTGASVINTHTAARRRRGWVSIPDTSLGGVWDQLGVFGGEEEEGGVKSGSGASRTILLFHIIISASPSKQNLSHPSTKCLRKSRLTRLTVVHLRGRKFSFCTPSPVHLSRTRSSLVASRRVSVSRMTPWLLLLTTSLLSTPLLLNSATCSP
jgi:hypothetical protein